MQRRFWNYLDDDLTKDITRWITGLMPAGLYRGFDFVPTANMNFTVSHATTGFKYVNVDLDEVGFLGAIITRQGVVIQDDTTLTLPIAANASGNPRIDLIFVSHQYEEFEGGSDAIYGTVQGTPGAIPVAPSLLNPLTDVALGMLYIPNGTTALNNAGVVFFKADIPVFSDNGNIPLKNKVNTFTKSQQIKSAKEIRIKEFNYTNGGSYTKQALEIDPDTNNYILDLDDAAQIGTYNPTSGTVALLIKPTAGFDNDLSGFCATVTIRGASGKRLRLVPTTPDPEPLVADGFYTCQNKSSIVAADSRTAASPEFMIDFATSTTKEHVFHLVFGGNKTFLLIPTSRMMDLHGGSYFPKGNPSDSLAIVHGSSHNFAIEKIVDWLKPRFQDSQIIYQNSTSTNIYEVEIPTLYEHIGGKTFASTPSVTITIQRIGNMRFVSGRISGVVNASGAGICQFRLRDLPSIDRPSVGYSNSNMNDITAGLLIWKSINAGAGQAPENGVVSTDYANSGIRMDVLTFFGSVPSEQIGITFSGCYKAETFIP